MGAARLIQPVRQNEEFLEDVEAARLEPDRLHLWWLGQSGFLMQWEGRHLVFDPYLSDSLTRKYAGTDKPHVRMTEIVVAPERLRFIQVATSSHVHTDHLDPETLGPLMRVNPDMRLIIAEANREVVVDRLNTMAEVPLGLDAGQSVRAAGFHIHAVPAAHNQVEKNEWGQHKFLGYVVEAGPWTVYHSGDTLRYPGMEEILSRWRIDVALLPINGNVPARGVAGNMDGREAAQLAVAIHAGLVIPCHFDMFEFNTVTPELFESSCRESNQPFRTLRVGERWSGDGQVLV